MNLTRYVGGSWSTILARCTRSIYQSPLLRRKSHYLVSKLPQFTRYDPRLAPVNAGSILTTKRVVSSVRQTRMKLPHSSNMVNILAGVIATGASAYAAGKQPPFNWGSVLARLQFTSPVSLPYLLSTAPTTVEEWEAQNQGKAPEELFPELPVYTMEEVQRHVTPDQRIWVVQGDYIYDVTDFVEVHPGGDKILQGRGKSVDPFWSLYTVHHTSKTVYEWLNQLRIGVLHKDDRDKLRAEVAKLKSQNDGVWKYEPIRSPLLVVHQPRPFNAETPLATVDTFVTPSPAFFVRNHHPVPITPQPLEAEAKPKNTSNDKDKQSLSSSSSSSSSSSKSSEPSPLQSPTTEGQGQDTSPPTTTTNGFQSVNLNDDVKIMSVPLDKVDEFKIRFTFHKTTYEQGTRKGIQSFTIPIPSSISSDPENASAEKPAASPAAQAVEAPSTVTIQVEYNEAEDCYESLLSIGQLKKLFPLHDITNSIICSGNRRSEFNATKMKTEGLNWGFGAISTGVWTGVKIADISRVFGISIENLSHVDAKHLTVKAHDAPFDTSIPSSTALNPLSDVILAFQLNNEILPQDHGYPVRFIAPGLSGNRQVKWVSQVGLGPSEASSPWHTGTPYRYTGPAHDPERPIEQMPAVYSFPVFSILTTPSPQAVVPTHQCSERTLRTLQAQLDRISQLDPLPKDNASPQGSPSVDGWKCIDAKGFAYAGKGVGIIRVDTSVIGHKQDHSTKNSAKQQTPTDPKADETQAIPRIPTSHLIWSEADIIEGPSKQEIEQQRAWAWSLFETEIPLPPSIQQGDHIHITSKAVDGFYNTQQETAYTSWNRRGILNTAWHPVEIQIGHDEDQDDESS